MCLWHTLDLFRNEQSLKKKTFLFHEACFYIGRHMHKLSICIQVLEHLRFARCARRLRKHSKNTTGSVCSSRHTRMIFSGFLLLTFVFLIGIANGKVTINLSFYHIHLPDTSSRKPCPTYWWCFQLGQIRWNRSSHSLRAYCILGCRNRISTMGSNTDCHGVHPGYVQSLPRLRTLRGRFCLFSRCRINLGHRNNNNNKVNK